jgi:hypothetical protein
MEREWGANAEEELNKMLRYVGSFFGSGAPLDRVLQRRIGQCLKMSQYDFHSHTPCLQGQVRLKVVCRPWLFR